MLLKPWRSLKDLKDDMETFASAFDQFLATATESQKIVMENIQCYYDCADKAHAAVGEEVNSMTYAAPLDEDLRQQLEIVRAQDLDPVAGLTEQDVLNARLSQLPRREHDFAMQAMCVAHSVGLTIPGCYDTSEEPLAKICDRGELPSISEWEEILKAVTREHGQAGLTMSAPGTDQMDGAAVLAGTPAASVSLQLRQPISQEETAPSGSQATTPLREMLNSQQRKAHDIMVECLENNANG